MYEVKCHDLKKDNVFTKIFWDYRKYNSFVNKCRFSKVIKVISIIDNSKYYD